MAMTVENDEQIKALSGADPTAMGADSRSQMLVRLNSGTGDRKQPVKTL